MKLTARLMADYARRITDSTPSARVQTLIEAVRDNMTAQNTRFRDVGSVLTDETRSLPVIRRKALAEKQKLTRVPVGIWEGQLFAGCFTLRDERLTIAYDLPEFASEQERLAGERYGFGIYSMFGHIAPDYPRLLRLGTEGVRALVKARAEAPARDGEASPSHAADAEKTAAFLAAVCTALDGLDAFAARHEAMLRQRAEGETDPARKAELLRTAHALSRCPKHPAETFLEACQAMWLTHLAYQITGNYLAIGRPDQFLYPYLKADLEAGRLTPDEAQEICDCFMLKFNERAQDNETAAKAMDLEAMQERNERVWRERKLTDIGQQRYNVRDSVDAVNHWNQNIVLGGTIPATGDSAVNLLSVMLLESFRRIRMTNPVTSVRIGGGTPEFFLRQVAETLKTGGGLPAVYNDDVMIAAYEKFGFPAEDARDYANNGCWEAILPGRTDFYFIKINTLKCLEWALNRGVGRVDGKSEVPDQGDPRAIGDFETLYARAMGNMRHVMELATAHMVATQRHRSLVAPTPLLSALLEGPVENGRDMTEMGTRYIVGGTIAEGMSHLIDSLCAIQKTVFEERFCGMGELVDALDANFEGHGALWARLSACPKYGGNDGTADAMGARVTADYAAIMAELDGRYPEMKFMPGIGTFSWYIAVGEATGASPDGRREGEPVASNFSPSAGAMTRGITGAIQSFAKMSLNVLPLGSPLDVGLSGRYVRGEDGTARLVGILKSFRELGGNLLTVSIADTEVLRAAQEHPEQYRDLRVRMGGWSAYFTMLSRAQQELHIKKSETGI